MDPNSIGLVPLSKEEIGTLTQTFREGELCEETSRKHTKIGVILPQTEENLRLPETREM